MATLNRIESATVTAPSAQTWRPRRAIFAALAVAASIALLQVIISSTFTYTGQKLQQLEIQRSDLQARVYQMEAEIAALTSMEHTNRTARERLGMVPAEETLYLSVAVPAPSMALLPGQPGPQAPPQATDTPWWKELLAILPLP